MRDGGIRRIRSSEASNLPSSAIAGAEKGLERAAELIKACEAWTRWGPLAWCLGRNMATRMTPSVVPEPTACSDDEAA